MRLIAALFMFSCTTAGAAQSLHPDSTRIITSDVVNFWRAYDRLTPTMTRADSVHAFDEEYIQRATPGLNAYVDARLKKADNLLMALGMLPRYMAAVRANTLALAAQEPRIRESLRKLEAFYPEAKYPDIYFVVAGFIAQGSVLDGKMVVAAEMVAADSTTPLYELPPFLRDVDLTSGGLPCILVHELVHYQQNNASDRSLLAQTLTEGVADFVTYKAIGCVPTARATYTFGEANEFRLWREFQQEMHGTDYSKWLYNGNTVKDRPSQLGYWMGYQIAEAYYDRAPNKRRALHELLNITDYRALLEKSGYGRVFDK